MIVAEPLFECLVAQFPDRPIGEFDWIFRDSLIESDSGPIREEILDDWSDEAELKLSDLGCMVDGFISIYCVSPPEDIIDAMR